MADRPPVAAGACGTIPKTPLRQPLYEAQKPGTPLRRSGPFGKYLVAVCYKAGLWRRDPGKSIAHCPLLSLDRYRRLYPVAGPGRARITRLPISGSTSITVLPMTRDLLCRVGAALYGEHWQASLAHDLGVPRRTVQRWAAGETRPRPTLRRDLARLVAARQDALGKLYRELSSS